MLGGLAMSERVIPLFVAWESTVKDLLMRTAKMPKDLRFTLTSQPAREGGPLERSADRRERNAGWGEAGRFGAPRGRGAEPLPTFENSSRWTSLSA